MKKRLLSLLLTVLLLSGMMPAALAGYENFTAQESYTPGQFTDVKESDWFAVNVRAGVEYGLIDGKTPSAFAPNSPLTVAETIKLAACLHSIYVTGSASFASVQPWYRPYVNYALQNGILAAECTDYEAPASRAVFAEILANALPAEALTEKNEIANGEIPDVPSSAPYAAAVYHLYRVGVLTGSNGGRFQPDSTIQRSEAAAILTRMADPALRQTVELSAAALTAADIRARCLPAVCKLSAYDAQGRVLGMGSGVILSPQGDAVTCGHLVNGVKRLVAEMPDGVKREVGIYDLDAARDIAYIRVVGSNLPYLELAPLPQAGETVYALGYPGGGAAKVTEGCVTNPKNTEYLYPLIESTAVVISGNSGGALLDSRGRLVGITVSSRDSGSPSFSVPVSAVQELEHGTAVTPAQYAAAHLPDAGGCYERLYPVPDFGVVTGAPLLGMTRDRGTHCFYYRQSDLTDGTRQLLLYYAALNENTFYQFSDGAFTSSAGYLYSVQMYETSYQGVPALGVFVSGMQSKAVGGLPHAA